MFICDQELKENLERWAAAEGRTVSNIMERIAIAVIRDYNAGVISSSPNPGQAITPNTNAVTSSDLDQIKKFVELLLGDRHERNGISFVIIGELLGLEASKLAQLYQLVKECRDDRLSKERTKND